MLSSYSAACGTSLWRKAHAQRGTAPYTLFEPSLCSASHTHIRHPYSFKGSLNFRLPDLQHARPIACLNCNLPFLIIEGPDTPHLHARLTWQGPCLRHTPAPHILVLGELGTTWKAKWQACPQRTLLSCFCCRCRWHGYPAPPQLPAASAQSPFRPISPLKAATMTIERALLSLSSHCTWCWCRR